MSLLTEIWADGPSDHRDPAAALERLCAALLEENRLQPQAVVAARIRLPQSQAFPTEVPRKLGWLRIPLFWEHGVGAGLHVEAHVRTKRRRRFRPIRLEEPHE